MCCACVCARNTGPSGITYISVLEAAHAAKSKFSAVQGLSRNWRSATNVIGAPARIWRAASHTMKKVILLSPVLLTLLLLIWTALVYRYSQYNSWHIYPALATVALVLVCHIALIVWNSHPEFRSAITDS